MRCPVNIPAALVSSSCMALSLLVNTPAVAAHPGYEVATQTVKFADLNLSRSDDIKTLYSRIRAAANQVCEPPDFRSVDTIVRVRQCKEQAIDRAVMDVQSAQLTTFHMATTMNSAVVR
jgi:UrcA family protein